MKLLKIALILLTLSAVIVIPVGCGSGATPTTAGEVVKVQRGNLVTQITGVGNLAFSQTVDLPFEIAGTVSEILVTAGDSVKKDQVLSRLDTSAWQDEIDTLTSQATTATRSLTAKKRAVTQAQQSLVVAQQGIQTANNTIISKQLSVIQAKINLQNAQLSLEDAEASSSDEVEIEIKQLQVELAQGQYNTALTDLKNAETYGMQNAQAAVDDAATKLVDAITAVGDAQTALDQANKNLADAKSLSPEVTAPFNGLITKVNVAGGDDIYKGTVAVTIADPNKFEASVMVSELNILKIKLGSSATVQVEAVSGVTYPATVSFIAPSATISSSVVNYEVVVELSSNASIQTSTTNVPSMSNSSANSSFGPLGGSSSFNGSGPPEQMPTSSNLSQEQLSQMQQMMQKTTSANSTSSVQLAQGLTVTVSIITAEATNVLLVPTQAITSQGGKTTVQVMVNGVAESRQVQTGISNSTYTEITSGLNEGDQVLVSQTSSSSTIKTTTTGGAPGGLFFGR
ncbi:MAG: HlyD family efflux transporter periplasmic adaptor subunit [Dehalococcoidales bacterium]